MSVLAFVRTPDAKPITPEHDDPASPVSLQSLTDFTNALAMVWTYANTVRVTDLAPVVAGNEPPWYNTLNANLTTMKGHAQDWVDTDGPAMTSIPQAIINFDNSFEGQYDTIVAILAAIGIGTPTPQQKQMLLTEMNALLGELTTQKGVIDAANVRLIGFNDNLSTDHTALTTGAASVTNAIGLDKQAVIGLQLAVKNLRADVDKWSAIATAAEVSIAIGFISAAIGLWMTLATFGAGAFVLVGGALVLGGAVAMTIAANVIIAQDTSAITATLAQISDENKQVVVLNTVATAVDGLVHKNAVAASAMQVIMLDWATLMGQMKGVIDSLSKAESDIGSILDIGDMKTTKLAWTQLAAFATSMQTSVKSISSMGTVPLNKQAA